ncbi:MAG: DUF819 family protein [Ferruginibacter sp.]|nr:DUF819 family protein [Cytophagales bacterium]
MIASNPPVFTNDAVVLGILISVLALIFSTAQSEHPFFKKFYAYVPALLLCYFIPSVLNSLGIVSGDRSQLYPVASRYLLPVSLVFLTVGVDFRAILRLGPKAVLMFLAGVLGIVAGGPLSIMIVSVFAPEAVGGVGSDAVWRGMATIAGSWIGGAANQAALREVFQPSDRLFSSAIAVDVVAANLWMAVLIYAAGRANQLDARMGADATAIEEVRKKIETYQQGIVRNPTLKDLLVLLAVGFGVTAVAHALADVLAPRMGPALAKFSLTSPFFWVVILVTALGLLLSFTRARRLEGIGASKLGSLFLYVLIATIGMKMDLLAIFANPSLFLVGFVWVMIHATVLLLVARLIRAPFFFTAVGSQACLGGAASTPIVAAAFHPALASVGVLLAVLGNAVGTYGGYLTALLMQMVAE